MKKPLSLFRRTAVILAIGLLLLQLATGSAIFVNLAMPLAQRSADDMANLLIISADLWQGLPESDRQLFAQELQQNYSLTLLEAIQEQPQNQPFYPYLYFLRNALNQRLPLTHNLQLSEINHEQFQVAFDWRGKRWHFAFSKERITPKPRQALAWIALSGLIATLTLAGLLAHRVTAPVAKLAKAVRLIGHNDDIAPLPEDSDAELAQLARIFNRTAHQLKVQRENQTTLLAGISHDLRSPLTRMKMAVGLLKESDTSPLLNRLEMDIAEMDQLIGAQLELARAQNPEPAQATDLNALLQDVADAISAQTPGRIQSPLDRPACTLTLAPTSLRRCLINLLNNAVRYAPESKIQLVLRQYSHNVFIGVRDQGPGIPSHLAEAVFRPFYRLEASRNRFNGGSGLGLAITQQLCQTHGWQIAIKARYGSGTSVWIQIPK